MSQPVTTTTDEDDLILRFLAAAHRLIASQPDEFQAFNRRDAKLVISWLRGLVGELCENGSLERVS